MKYLFSIICISLLPAISLAAPLQTLISEYNGIVLNESKGEDVIKLYGETKYFEIPFGHHEFGRCYSSGNGITILFSDKLGSETNNVMITSDFYSENCLNIEQKLSNCIERFCLGISKEELVKLLGRDLLPHHFKDYEYVKFNHKRNLNDNERAYIAVEFADVVHILTVGIRDNVVYMIEIHKSETF